MMRAGLTNTLGVAPDALGSALLDDSDVPSLWVP